MKLKHPWRWIFGILAGILLSAGIYVSYSIYQFGQETKCEYETIGVVRMVEDHVKTHDGEWPSSWDDLDRTETAMHSAPLNSSYYRQYTNVNFTLTAEQLIANPALIYGAVMPITGHYSVYPHARSDLDGVMQAIRDAKLHPHDSKPQSNK